MDRTKSATIFNVPPWEISEVGYIVLVWTRDKHKFEDGARVVREGGAKLCHSMQIVQGYGGVLSMMVEGVLLWRDDRSWADLVLEEVCGRFISVIGDHIFRITVQELAEAETPEPFNFSNPGDWPKWIRRFERFRQASGLINNPENEQVNMLVYCMGDNADDILLSCKIASDQLENYNIVIECFESHFIPRHNIIYERARFNQRCQQEGEKVNEFITALHSLAEHCNFGMLHDELIRDRIVVGVRDRALSERMQLDTDLTLVKATLMTKQLESVKEQQSSLYQQDSVDQIKKVPNHIKEAKRHEPKIRQFKSNQLGGSSHGCTRCGNSNNHDWKNCPAMNSYCSKCKKKGHYAKVCRSEAINEIKSEIAFLGSVEDNSKKWIVPIKVNNRQINFKIDTGADVNVLPLQYYYQSFQRIKLEKSDKILQGPNGIPLETVGMIHEAVADSVVDSEVEITEAATTAGKKATASLNVPNLPVVVDVAVDRAVMEAATTPATTAEKLATEENQRKSKKACYTCGEFGHKKDDCPKSGTQESGDEGESSDNEEEDKSKKKEEDCYLTLQAHRTMPLESARSREMRRPPLRHQPGSQGDARMTRSKRPRRIALHQRPHLQEMEGCRGTTKTRIQRRASLQCQPCIQDMEGQSRYLEGSCKVHSLRHFISTGLPAQRVVVTGMGAVTPLGVGTSTAWKALLAGRSGIVALDGEEYQNIPAKVAAPIPNLDLTTLFRNSELNSMSRATAFALIAAAEAFNDAGWQPGTEEECEGTGVVVGMGMSDLADILHTGTLLRDRGYNKVSPFFVPRILINMAAGQISIKYKLKGPNHCSSTACATGVHAIGDAYNLIRSGQAQAMMCGSTEAVISPLSIAAFARMKALSSSFNSTPEIASRPFDKQREGFVMGEGAGILLLESLEHAQKRNAKVYAEILGYGLSGDAHHITAPSKDGGGALRCMRSALKNSGMPITSVGYINAHATSTPLGDAVEIEAIRRTFEQHVSNLKISSSKGSIGHLLGGAGSVESIFTILACHHGICPPTLNLQEADDKFKDLNLVPLTAQSWSDSHRIAVKNSFGFGGTNASLVIGSYS
ncbi:OXSM [Cordylochernes scorpioides]|uniref:beta-ketoacyl-[acyl-carrier-protein] synthase I n=1 Tax=Cordylochernes scorpioides TaxID=51811 RepID=A0ABY6JZB7_9ARAC|nr:OXSM [Cordylochernes scorpioides]